MVGIRDLIPAKTRHGDNSFSLPGYKPVLPFIVQTHDPVPVAYKILGEKLAVYIVEKDNARCQREARIPKIKDKVFPAGKKKKLQGQKLPKNMGDKLFIKDNLKIFVWGDFLNIGGNNYCNFTGGA